MFGLIETRSAERSSRFGVVSFSLMMGAFLLELLLESGPYRPCAGRLVHNWAFWCAQVVGIVFWASWLVGLVGLKIDTRKWAALTASLLWLPLFLVLVLVGNCF